jgi:rhamnogalacturonyl hydrolase YesR
MTASVTESFLKLKSYCEAEEYKGWDPYDGLNSKVFQATPLKYSKYARLVWIQLFKRNPINLRKMSCVPKGYNPKGLGLFLTGYCNLYQIAEAGDTAFGTKEEILGRINYLANLLIELQTEGYSGACWGYNFDWQARGGLYFPAYTPNVVATTFASNALLNAYQILEKKKLRKVAVSSADFVIHDLNRTQKEEGFLFSYAPEFGNNTVYNASLLASKLLARVFSVVNNKTYFRAAKDSVTACCRAQNADGSWHYGELPIQDWVDSFHTGFNLEAIYDYQQYTGDRSFERNFEDGFKYYIENFFLEDGTPKYYDNQTYPIDIHSPAQLLISLSKCNKWQPNSGLAEKVFSWTNKHMQDDEGYYYYQLHKLYKNKTPYMRWSQAWMFAALSYYFKESGND